MLTGRHDTLIVKRRVDIGAPLDGEGPLAIAVDVYAQAGDLSRPVVLFCLPGGGVNKRYFDLEGAGSDHVSSFAREMAARGFIVAAFDPIGVGESSRPENGFALTTETVMRCQAHAVERLADDMRKGLLSPDIPPLPEFIGIGMGHSMGALLTIVQQAARKDYSALVLLCFATVGLPALLSDADRESLAKPDGGRGDLVEMARRRFGGNAYPRAVPREQAPSAASRALRALQDAILAIPATQSMTPGSVRSEAAQITVPIFLGVCEKDMTGPPHLLPAEYPACNDLTLMVLKVAGHHPFVAAGGEVLYDRLAAWLDMVARQAGP